MGNRTEETCSSEREQQYMVWTGHLCLIGLAMETCHWTSLWALTSTGLEQAIHPPWQPRKDRFPAMPMWRSQRSIRPHTDSWTHNFIINHCMVAPICRLFFIHHVCSSISFNRYCHYCIMQPHSTPCLLYEAIQYDSAELCFIFHNVHSVLYFLLENIVLE